MPDEGRHAPASPRRTPLLIAGVVALVAVLTIGAVVLLSGNGAGIIPGVGSDTPPAPEFAFVVGKPKVETTAPIDPEATVNAAQAKAAAAPAASQVAEQLNGLYLAAFLDPANWTEGTYETLEPYFAKSAQSAAAKQAKVLTAGAGVTDLDSILPLKSTAKLTVLLDPAGNPVAVAGTVNFQAKGSGGGSVYVFQSKGQYVFRKIEGEWKVVSFSVRRSDTEKAPASSTASSSASPTEEAS